MPEKKNGLDHNFGHSPDCTAFFQTASSLRDSCLAQSERMRYIAPEIQNGRNDDQAQKNYVHLKFVSYARWDIRISLQALI